jgi:threonine aldolase
LSDGGIDPDRIRSAVRGANLHHPPTTLLALENTHNFCGGKVLSLESTRILTEVAQELGLQTHMDGARIFNAQAESGVPAAQLVETVDTVSFCLSKGLSAPVGSLLCGSESFIGRARKVRKMLGGGMRQAGIIAAAGLVALDEMVDRLSDDHANAKRLAEGLAALGYEVRPSDVESNIIVIPVEDSAKFQRRLADRGVLATVLSDRLGRLVTHSDVTTADIDEALNRIEQARAVPA